MYAQNYPEYRVGGCRGSLFHCLEALSRRSTPAVGVNGSSSWTAVDASLRCVADLNSSSVLGP
jgi:hypothetical protein